MTSMSQKFCKDLPKIELHAHLNGSLSIETLKEIKCMDTSIAKYRKLTNQLEKNELTLEKCFETFNVAHHATSKKENLYIATKRVIEEFAADNVIYLELRTTPKTGIDMSRDDYIDTVVQAIQEKEKDIVVNLLLSLDRRQNLQECKEIIGIILNHKTKYPDIIKGVDWSGNPTVGDFNKELFLELKKQLLITIHCGEVANNEEVNKILEFNPDRIGHATYLHPKYGGCLDNWEIYRGLKIPLECCLTSNVACGTVKSYKEHHIGEWIANSLPFSLATDDKGVFSTSLSEEYNHLFENFNISTEDLWTISNNSVDYSFATDSQKHLLKDILKKWKEEKGPHIFTKTYNDGQM